MYTDEQIEKARQAIMRFRELLDILHGHLAEAEAEYQQLFDGLNLEGLREKEQQREAAYGVVADPTKLMRAASHMRFVSRNLERDFEQVHDNLVVEE